MWKFKTVRRNQRKNAEEPRGVQTSLQKQDKTKQKPDPSKRYPHVHWVARSHPTSHTVDVSGICNYQRPCWGLWSMQPLGLWVGQGSWYGPGPCWCLCYYRSPHGFSWSGLPPEALLIPMGTRELVLTSVAAAGQCLWCCGHGRSGCAPLSRAGPAPQHCGAGSTVDSGDLVSHCSPPHRSPQLMASVTDAGRKRLILPWPCSS